MKYLKRMEIINFQSHKYTDLYFDNKVNVIIGPSDSGKTAIIRAIKWVLFNEPSGTEFIRKGNKDAEVILYFENNLIIKRGRNKSKNYYEITLPSGNTERFEGFGTKVPAEIVELTGIKKVELDGNNLISLSISDQLESPFLLTESPSVKAIAIGKIAGVEKIDLALNKLSKDINEINSEKKSLEKEKNIHLDSLKKYDYLEDESKELEYIDNLLKTIDDKSKLFNKFTELNKSYSNIKNRIDSINYSIDKFANLDKFETLLNQVINIFERYTLISNINMKLSYILKNIKKENNILNKTKNMNDLIRIQSIINEKLFKYQLLLSLKNKLHPIDLTIKNTTIFLNTTNTEKLDKIYITIEKLENKFNKLYNLNSKLLEINKRIKNGNKYMDNFLLLNNAENKINIVSEKILLRDRLNRIFNSIVIIDKKIFSSEQIIDRDIETSKFLVNKYIDLLKRSAICPYCFNELDEEHLNKIISEYEV